LENRKEYIHTNFSHKYCNHVGRVQYLDKVFQHLLPADNLDSVKSLFEFAVYRLFLLLFVEKRLGELCYMTCMEPTPPCTPKLEREILTNLCGNFLEFYKQVYAAGLLPETTLILWDGKFFYNRAYESEMKEEYVVSDIAKELLEVVESGKFGGKKTRKQRKR
jgi:hypothetical protein